MSTHSEQAGVEPAAPPRAPIECVICQERRLLRLEAHDEQPVGIGLALSGGGIRSASFALGVAQQLSVTLGNRLQTFHYLSTVSGGGYMGTAISWLRHHYRGKFEKQLGSKETGDRSAEWRAGQARAAGETERVAKTPPAKVDKTWLDYVRMHGNYLLPDKITVLSLVGVGLRSLLFTLVIYGGAAVAVLALLNDSRILSSWCPLGCSQRPWFGIERWALLSLGVLGAQILLYGIASWLTSVPFALGALATALVIAGGAYGAYALLPWVGADWDGKWPYLVIVGLPTFTVFGMTIRVLRAWLKDPAPRRSLQTQIRLWSYRLRTRMQRWLGIALGVSFGLLVLWSLPSAYHWLRSAASWAPAAVGGSASVVTGVATILKFLMGQKKDPNPGFLDRAIAGIAPIIGAAAVVGGGLILAYGIQAGGWYLPRRPCVWVAPQMSLPVAGSLLVGVLVLGFFCNANYLSLGRMYRDRLMEMFMPNKSAIETTEWEPATDAEGFRISELLPDVKDSGRLLHLVCCNVILSDAAQDSYRGRGGDSFVFSPLYSGSSATGWARSDLVAERGMSLATAMATSGAAANPDAAVAGAGITRNRLVAFLMWVFNVRLGYWLRNLKYVPERGREGFTWPPNFWIPGLWQGLLGRGLDADASHVELSDGGHFDNTGLYELIRRRVDIIVLSQASADPNYQMDDLANAIERVRADFGVHIRFDIPGFEPQKIRPRCAGTDGKSKASERYADRGYALATIHYPRLGAEKGQSQSQGQATKWKGWDTGYLLYLQATKVKGIESRVDIDSYARIHPNFPNESTANQFFDEDQLEAYRELGMEVTQQAFREIFYPQKSETRPRMADYLERELGVIRE